MITLHQRCSEKKKTGDICPSSHSLPLKRVYVMDELKNVCLVSELNLCWNLTCKLAIGTSPVENVDNILTPLTMQVKTPSKWLARWHHHNSYYNSFWNSSPWRCTVRCCMSWFYKTRQVAAAHVVSSFRQFSLINPKAEHESTESSVSLCHNFCIGILLTGHWENERTFL